MDIIEINTITNEINFLDFSDKEKEARAKLTEERTANQIKMETMEATKATQKAALLAKLGITADEAALLLS